MVDYRNLPHTIMPRILRWFAFRPCFPPPSMNLRNIPLRCAPFYFSNDNRIPPEELPFFRSIPLSQYMVLNLRCPLCEKQFPPGGPPPDEDLRVPVLRLNLLSLGFRARVPFTRTGGALKRLKQRKDVVKRKELAALLSKAGFISE